MSQLSDIPGWVGGGVHEEAVGGLAALLSGIFWHRRIWESNQRAISHKTSSKQTRHPLVMRFLFFDIFGEIFAFLPGVIGEIDTTLLSINMKPEPTVG